MPPTDHVQELVCIMARLRGPGGCPWDHEQDHQTLKRYLIEETYEVIDAIDDGDDPHLVEELGDVLLQVVFHSQIASETQRFDLQEVAKVCCEKLIRRHPHVFAAAEVADADAVLKQWEAIKQQERKHQPATSLLDGVPRQLPALSLAQKTQKKAAKVGFDWPNVDGALAKLEEEIKELRATLADATPERRADELGDLLFAAVNVSRFADVDPEECLRAATAKFRRRFQFIEAAIKAAGKDFKDYDLAALDRLWDAAKAAEKATAAPPPRTLAG